VSEINLLMIGGVPDDNMVEVRSWRQGGIDLLFDGNVTADAVQRDPRINPIHLVLGGSSAARELNLQRRPDVAFNLICNAESSMRALNSAASICKKLEADGIPVLNPPDRVRETTRTASLAFFSGLDKVRVPVVRKLNSPTTRELVALLNSGEIDFPVIVRTINDHNGRDMIRLRGAEDFDGLEQLPFDGRDFYVIAFSDYKNSDGLYRKYRLIKVGRNILPRHLIISEDWKIHVAQRNEDVNFSSEARAREDAYLANPRSCLGGALYDQLVMALERTGLDYVGVDFGLYDDGSAVLFECNACTNAATLSPRSGEPAKRATVKRKIEAAFYECVREAAQLE
jgi:hypothetical protein